MKDSLVTIFGGGGFLGRQVAQALMARGARVRIAQRDLASAVKVKSLGNLGQSQFVAADIRKPETVARAIAGSDVVINLVGILAGDFEAFHHQGAANVARAASAAGVKALVHVSAIGADAASPSAYGRSKAAGEEAVRAAFPTATIIRPSIIFGPEDQFLNRFADIIRLAPVVPVIGAATKFQPVYVADVAQAIANAAEQPGVHGGKTYEVAGPQVMSMKEINAWIAKAIGRDRPLVEVPGGFASLLAMLPGGPITRDQLAMLGRDNVPAPGAPGLEALGVAPTPLGAVADKWMVRYRKHGRFAGRAKA
ncbi:MULTISPECIES: complex I NDUFA9 subunit family protein [unclassified Sphingobium]|jgi:NADH dehydrogenase|uniref:complex I NDUFA9 subunit family protein n=1 Tax=unclassified Sphingobium TaxID=2611147 RepID=UPI0007F48C69|nr:MULTISPECIES: complex I NDUFA9 subunit family protein [unclassified Sphingobium]OAN52051.1 3-beta hydroxysteroid dehydrogenase [Sphingobium sp. TCM1]WIW88224.1 complex I NDUFA9 subunit family protein [Sphingobium sp. V4]